MIWSKSIKKYTDPIKKSKTLSEATECTQKWEICPIIQIHWNRFKTSFEIALWSFPRKFYAKEGFIFSACLANSIKLRKFLRSMYIWGFLGRHEGSLQANKPITVNIFLNSSRIPIGPPESSVHLLAYLFAILPQNTWIMIRYSDTTNRLNVLFSFILEEKVDLFLHKFKSDSIFKYVLLTRYIPNPVVVSISNMQVNSLDKYAALTHLLLPNGLSTLIREVHETTFRSNN